MSDAWYYVDNEEVAGPFSLADLRVTLRKSSNWKNLLVWRQGFNEWQRAGSSDEFLSRPAMPPIPNSSDLELRPERTPAPEKSGNRPVARIFGGIVLLAVGGVVGAAWVILDKGAYEFGKGAYASVTRSWLGKNAGDIDDEYAKALVKLRAELPKKIDETTTLKWVKSEGTKLIFEILVAVDGAKLDDATKSKLRHSVTKMFVARLTLEDF